MFSNQNRLKGVRVKIHMLHIETLTKVVHNETLARVVLLREKWVEDIAVFALKKNEGQLNSCNSNQKHC
jgi:hypothetical protein